MRVFERRITFTVPDGFEKREDVREAMDAEGCEDLIDFLSYLDLEALQDLFLDWDEDNVMY